MASRAKALQHKHYVENNQEFGGSDVSERALRALKYDGTWYNRVNGTHVSEDERLIKDILHKEWGYKGWR